MPSTATSILDGLSTSVAVKAPCRTVATSNITLAGLQTISGYTTVENDRVLVKGQTNAVDNGIYMASTGTWTRAKDADGNRDFVQGTVVRVRSTTIDGVEYELTTANPIVIGTTALTFELRYGANATYDQTEGEIAAGVDPPNKNIVPGNVLRYGTNTVPGTTDMTTAINNALASNKAVYAPAGQYRVTSSILINPYNELYGDGWGGDAGSSAGDGTVFYSTTDIEVIASSNANDEALPCIHLHDFSVRSTVSSASSPTKYQIHLRNPLISTIARVYVRSGLGDTDYSTTNVAGIWLEDSDAGLEGPYINRITGCFVQNGSLLLSTGNTDGTIIDNFIYGHPCAFSLKFDAVGGNWSVIANNLTSPPDGSGIFINGGNLNQFRIISNFFDGNPTALDSGYGILIKQAPRVVIANNHVWAMGKAAVRAEDPVGLIVKGNIFQNCNDDDDSYSDVEIVGDTFQPSTCIVANNWHQQETSRTNKGYAIREVNDGFNPVQNVYMGNQVSSNYLTTGSYGAIQTLQGGDQAPKVVGNSGGSTDTEVTGSFTATLTGITTVQTGTVNYRREGRIIILEIPTIAGVSNTTAATLTGMPAAIRPSATRGSACGIINNSVNAMGQCSIASSGVITLSQSDLTGAFTAANNKGVLTSTVVYSL